MSSEQILMCQNCRLTFESNEELTIHSCVKIKEENQDSKDKIDSTNGDSNSDRKQVGIFEPALDLVKVKLEESEEAEENEPIKLKKKRKRPKKTALLDLPDLVDSYQDLELSEDFLTTILKYVDDLCDIISNGDPNVERKVEVIQNLNNDVTCYRNELDVKKQIFEESNDQDYYTNEAILSDLENDYLDEKKNMDFSDQPPKKKRKKYKVKKEGENNSASKTTSGTKLKKDFGIDDVSLFPYLKYDNETDMFECSICSKSTKVRNNLLRHIKIQHRSGIKTKTEDIGSSENPEKRYDCEAKICKKFYGYNQRQLWCVQCTILSQIPKKPKKYWYDPKKYQETKQYELCPECGKNVTNLKAHFRDIHSTQKHKCPHCPEEKSSVKYLKQHIKTTHQKIPCVQCGELIGEVLMNRHIQAKHTPNDQKKYRCEVCGKGFNTNQKLKEHNNIHTGEKPFKCKFCSACFASRGTHAMHQRSHLGHHRSHSKK